jgi:CRISPR-associated protein Csb2
MRDALMSQMDDLPSEWISGHAADGAASARPHLAIAPLANVGFPYSDGRLMGLALILPRDREESWKRAETPQAFEERRAFLRALDRLHVREQSEPDETVVELRLGPHGLWRLRYETDSELSTLDPNRYCASSRSWSTVTPVAIDRFPKAKDVVEQLQEAADLVAGSCLRIGLPLPKRVRVHKHPAVAGSPSAWPPTGAPKWTGWARPKSLANRPLFHATLEFAEPVTGPVILGAGRFFGLGLFLAIDIRERQ